MIKSIYPDIIIKTSGSVNISDFLAYKIIFLNPKDMNVDDIILYKNCPKCGKNLKYTDCFNREKQQISLIRTCHSCHIIYILNGKCSSIYQFNYIYNYFKDMRMRKE